ncbi:ATP-binding protein [Variovorax sp. OV700]|uniref:ATP-binding protein n=1 Tax=Variovorax sp. OV700 TaxID=1882826 RepID=UPI001113662F|nr:ATP-binding protein [Variovorax sp. OV700]
MSKLNVSLTDRFAEDATAVWQISELAAEQADLFDVDLGVWFKFVEIVDPSKVAAAVQECVQKTLSDAAQLLWKTGVPNESQDKRGTWTIALVFIVQRLCRQEWERAVQDLRAESGFTEEFSIDLIDFDDLSTLAAELSNGNAVPQLLFASRRLLQLPVSEIEGWLSADTAVKRLLEHLPDRFANAQERKMVALMAASVIAETSSSISNPFPAQPLQLPEIKINGMRNISDFSLALESPGKRVFSHIIHGPNGTGKSSIFEGLSFAVARSSRRLVEYLRDPDIFRPMASAYVKAVLTPLRGVQPPKIEVNGIDALLDLPSDERQAEQRLIDSDGTLLAQEDARSFVETTGRQLGARVLSGYSTLAQNLQSFCEREYNEANLKRQTWLREFGIAASVTKEESRLTKLVDYFINRYHPPGTQQIIFWLEALAQRIPEHSVEARSIAFDWTEADSKIKRDELAKIIIQLEKLGADAECERAVYGWLERRNRASTQMLRLRKQTAHTCADMAQQRSELEEDLFKWRAWLQGRRTPNAIVSNTKLVEQQTELSKRLLEVKNLGLSLAEHQQHLRQVQGTFLISWASDHPDVCPTCGSNHAAEGGILATAARLATVVEEQIVATRKRYAEILAQLREVQKEAEQVGNCPLSEERRIFLAHLLGMPGAGYEALEEILSDNVAMESILRSVDLLISPPDLAVIEDTSVAARRVWNAIEVENGRGAALWELPAQWARIRDIIDKECLAIIQQHLPKTLQAVWTELAMTMTPARWNLSDRPRLLAENKRGNESLRIVVGADKRQIGARHIFNQAENHVLGLAWFFTRYMSSGRFRHSLIALDDPAQEMDQTTFRCFTRLIQTLCRLHERFDQPLTLVLLLHQEDRALDASRATNHQLTSLRWAKEISSAESVEQLVLISPEFKAPLPKPLQLSSQGAVTTN